jgi:hypothetical protein
LVFWPDLSLLLLRSPPHIGVAHAHHMISHTVCFLFVYVTRGINHQFSLHGHISIYLMCPAE